MLVGSVTVLLVDWSGGSGLAFGYLGTQVREGGMGTGTRNGLGCTAALDWIGGLELGTSRIVQLSPRSAILIDTSSLFNHSGLVLTREF
jgi:hypothetical protein